MNANIRKVASDLFEIIFTVRGKVVGLEYRETEKLARGYALTMNADKVLIVA
jgi:hypothetical protein